MCITILPDTLLNNTGHSQLLKIEILKLNYPVLLPHIGNIFLYMTSYTGNTGANIGHAELGLKWPVYPQNRARSIRNFFPQAARAIRRINSSNIVHPGRTILVVYF